MESLTQQHPAISWLSVIKMVEIIQCDRCGARNLPTNSNNLTTYKNWWEGNITFDLCNKCRKALLRWLDE